MGSIFSFIVCIFCLLDKKNCIIDELNKVLVTSERVVATLPASSSGLEAHCPLIFIDSSEMDSAENLTELDEFLPLIGDTYILPKEQSDDYIDLPIINELGALIHLNKSKKAKIFFMFKKTRLELLPLGIPRLTRTLN